MKRKPVVLLILDGWGNGTTESDNSIFLANTPNYDEIVRDYPMTELQASGTFVGLPEGQMGNSEVGHLNIGSGRVVYQELTRIDKSIEMGDFFTNPVLKDAMEKAIKNHKKIHLAGLLSDGGVHSHLNHLKALVTMAKDLGAETVYLHGILDGRDVPPKSAGTYIEAMESFFKAQGIGAFASIAGRFYTMDRDKRFERLEKGYEVMVDGKGLKGTSALEALEMAYERGETDEFVMPTAIYDEAGPITIDSGDALIFFNFRSDRAREISRVFLDETFDAFKRKPIEINYVCMTEYDETLEGPVAFPPETLKNTLGEVLSQRNYRQLRGAETEKYAHVTFFFNGGVEAPNQGEDRVLIPSPKVKTYDLQPEMSLFPLTEAILKALDEAIYDVLIINFANGDMVGHTGILEASIAAVEAVDQSLGKLRDKVLEKNGVLLVTADHGNCETMINPETKGPLTAHTLNPVPFILIAKDSQNYPLRHNQEIALRDIAPTILDLLEEPLPKEMTGQSLILKNKR